MSCRAEDDDGISSKAVTVPEGIRLVAIEYNVTT
jgi:hypothetical protein